MSDELGPGEAVTPRLFTVEELGDYLDAGRSPYDPAIEESPENLGTLRAMERIRALSGELIDGDARELPALREGWLGAVLADVRREARAGRDIPLSAPAPGLRLSITEGAVRGLVRDAGDSVPGVLIGRCRLIGDVADPDAEITIEVTASVFWGVPIAGAARQVRERIYSRLLEQSELHIAAIDVRITDVHLANEETR